MEAMLRMLVDRCHVGESNRAVIRYVVSRLRKPHWKTFRGMPREARREMMRAVIRIHAENRELYAQVMRGGF